jgi:hypothetical protein
LFAAEKDRTQCHLYRGPTTGPVGIPALHIDPNVMTRPRTNVAEVVWTPPGKLNRDVVSGGRLKFSPFALSWTNNRSGWHPCFTHRSECDDESPMAALARVDLLLVHDRDDTGCGLSRPRTNVAEVVWTPPGKLSA